MSRSKIGGWHRLWIVGSVLWVAIVAATAIALAPDFSSVLPRQEEPSDLMPPQEQSDALTYEERRRRIFEEPEERAREALVRHYGAAFGIAVVPPLLLYVFGWAVGWIVQGFRG